VNGPKVFGIGYHKTGTTSLGMALKFLRYNVCHGARPVRGMLGHRKMMELLHGGDLAPILDIARGFDAFEDNPWFVLYRELDRAFPGSRFILTVRDEERWLDSAIRHCGDSTSDLREWIYGVGSPVIAKDIWLESYRRHAREVRDYFRDRPADLLVVNWERGDGWAELCGFLGHRLVTGPFPHLNKGRPT
jgi:hypothetical protein